MKKILGIMVLGLLWCNVGLAKCIKGDCNNGQGTWEFKSGDKYIGEHKNGRANGQGTYIFTNGDKYVGGHKDDQRHGQGSLTTANGSKHIGEFNNGKANGNGIFISLDGRKNVGEFKNNDMSGQGTYFWPDGSNYVGEWIDNNMNGQGSYTLADGKILNGIFKNNELIEENQITKTEKAKQELEEEKLAEELLEAKKKLKIKLKEEEEKNKKEKIAENKRLEEEKNKIKVEEKNLIDFVLNESWTSSKDGKSHFACVKKIEDGVSSTEYEYSFTKFDKKRGAIFTVKNKEHDALYNLYSTARNDFKLTTKFIKRSTSEFTIVDIIIPKSNTDYYNIPVLNDDPLNPFPAKKFGDGIVWSKTVKYKIINKDLISYQSKIFELRSDDYRLWTKVGERKYLKKIEYIGSNGRGEFVRCK